MYIFRYLDIFECILIVVFQKCLENTWTPAGPKLFSGSGCPNFDREKGRILSYIWDRKFSKYRNKMDSGSLKKQKSISSPEENYISLRTKCFVLHFWCSDSKVYRILIHNGYHLVILVRPASQS